MIQKNIEKLKRCEHVKIIQEHMECHTQIRFLKFTHTTFVLSCFVRIKCYTLREICLWFQI